MTPFNHSDRLRRLSKAMAMLTTLGILLIAAAMIRCSSFPTGRETSCWRDWARPGTTCQLSPGHLIAGAAITAVPVGVLLFGLWQVRALFLNFANGHVFTLTSARRCVILPGPCWRKPCLDRSRRRRFNRVHVEQSAGQSPACYRPVGARLSGADRRRRAARGRLGHGRSDAHRRRKCVLRLRCVSDADHRQSRRHAGAAEDALEGTRRTHWNHRTERLAIEVG